MDTTDVYSVRCVGTRAGYPYVALGCYRPTVCRDGVMRYKLVGSYPWHRTEQAAMRDLPVNGRYVCGVRHNTIFTSTAGA